MKRILIFLLCLLQFSCAAQGSNEMDLSVTDYSVLGRFLEQAEPYTYVDNHFFDENMITRFIGKYEYHINFQRNADSICRLSEDMEKKKFYCPLADKFAYLEGLLDENDLDYLEDNYNQPGQAQTMKIDSIITDNRLKRHSESYYQNIDYEKNLLRIETSEFPSIRIQNLYYTKDRSVAIIAYSIFSNSIKAENNFFILKNIDDIWWKPLGSFQL